VQEFLAEERSDSILAPGGKRKENKYLEKKKKGGTCRFVGKSRQSKKSSGASEKKTPRKEGDSLIKHSSQERTPAIAGWGKNLGRPKVGGERKKDGLLFRRKGGKAKKGGCWVFREKNKSGKDVERGGERSGTAFEGGRAERPVGKSCTARGNGSGNLRAQLYEKKEE